MDRIGVRELRNRVAAVVRRAGAGERIVITVDGEPVAQLGPLEAPGSPTIDDLAAAGLIRLPHRADQPSAPDPVAVPVDVRVEAVLGELRGDDQRSRR
jgi:prevent-host-death family protein